jgi:ATPase family AAA domain-containing protein 3A/B
MSRSNVRTLVREVAKHDARFSTTARETADAAAHGAANAGSTSSTSAIRALAATTFAAVVSVPTAMCAPFGLGGKKESSPPSDQKFESEIKASRSNKSGANAAFDPEALERGAKALREINQSPYATKVLELSRTQEQTKQSELRAREAEAAAAAAAHATEREKVMWSEQSRVEKERSQQQAQLKQYDDELARKRMATEHEQRRQRNAEMVKLQEEGVERQEAIKRATEEKIQRERRETERYRAELERENLRAKAIAEAEGRIAENRKNEDVIRRQMIAKVTAETDKAVKLVNETLGLIGGGFNSILGDRDRMMMFVGSATALAAGVYASREGARFGFRQLEKYIGQPSLIRETSRGSFWKPKPAAAASTAAAPAQANGILGDVVLGNKLQERVQRLAVSTANTKKHSAPFRNILFHGPPGTGKTMAAKRLARYSGLDYAVMTGGDVAPLGANAVTKLHEMFDWASTSRKGLLLFIDEADAFLAKRGSDVAGTESRAALNALLYRTGEMNRDVALVLATNRPEDLDKAVLDRMDESVEIGLPDLEARKRMVKLYFDKLIVRGADAGDDKPAKSFFGGLFRRSLPERPIEVKDVTDADLDAVAAKTEGLSGREISKLMASVQAAAHGSSDGACTKAMLEEVTTTKLAENKTKAKWG